MVEPESTPASSRRSTAAQRHRRLLRRRIFGAIGIALVIILAALWFSDTLRIPTDGPTFAGGADSYEPSSSGRRVEGSVEPSRRALNALQPLKIWVGGDSLAGALGPSLGRMVGTTGVAQAYVDSRVSTGLIAGDIDWNVEAEEELADVDPEVVVFMIGTNDAIVYDDSQAEAYAQRTAEMMRILIGPGRDVYWVNAPVMGDDDVEENILEIDRIQREVAARYPDQITFVDAHTLFADEQGEYQSSMLDESGRRVSLRAGDGIHLTGAGADHLATHVFDLLDAEWRIQAQAVPGQTKRVIMSKGSTQVPSGGSSGSSGSGSGSSGFSGSSSGGSTSGTTPTSSTTAATTPTTAPPDTTPTTASTTPTTAPPTPPSS
jgi:hypothetical protein